MNTLILISAWILIIAQIVDILLIPFLFGKPREPYSASNYIGILCVSILVILVSGRVIGWW